MGIRYPARKRLCITSKTSYSTLQVTRVWRCRRYMMLWMKARWINLHQRNTSSQLRSSSHSCKRIASYSALSLIAEVSAMSRFVAALVTKFLPKASRRRSWISKKPSCSLISDTKMPQPIRGMVASAISPHSTSRGPWKGATRANKSMKRMWKTSQAAPLSTWDQRMLSEWICVKCRSKWSTWGSQRSVTSAYSAILSLRTTWSSMRSSRWQTQTSLTKVEKVFKAGGWNSKVRCTIPSLPILKVSISRRYQSHSLIGQNSLIILKNWRRQWFQRYHKMVMTKRRI